MVVKLHLKLSKMEKSLYEAKKGLKREIDQKMAHLDKYIDPLPFRSL